MARRGEQETEAKGTSTWKQRSGKYALYNQRRQWSLQGDRQSYSDTEDTRVGQSERAATDGNKKDHARRLYRQKLALL